MDNTWCCQNKAFLNNTLGTERNYSGINFMETVDPEINSLSFIPR